MATENADQSELFGARIILEFNLFVNHEKVGYIIGALPTGAYSQPSY